MNCFIVNEKPINLIGTKAALNDEMNVFDTQVVSTNALYRELSINKSAFVNEFF